MHSDETARAYRAAIALAATLIWIKSDLINTALVLQSRLVLSSAFGRCESAQRSRKSAYSRGSTVTR